MLDNFALRHFFDKCARFFLSFSIVFGLLLVFRGCYFVVEVFCKYSVFVQKLTDEKTSHFCCDPMFCATNVCICISSRPTYWLEQQDDEYTIYSIDRK